MNMRFPRPNYYIAIFIFVAVFALALNTLHFAKVQHEKSVAKIQLAAFIEPNPGVSLDVLRERIVNQDGVKGLYFYSSDKALEKALKDTPSIKEVLVGGDNPFPSYFLITPRYPEKEAVEYLKEAVGAMAGIEEVRLDQNLLNISDKLRLFISFYENAIKAIFFLCLLVVLAKIGWAVYKRTADFRRYAFLSLSGAVISSFAAAVYVIAASKILHSPLSAMPLNYILFLIPCGILLSLIWDN